MAEMLSFQLGRSERILQLAHDKFTGSWIALKLFKKCVHRALNTNCQRIKADK